MKKNIVLVLFLIGVVAILLSVSAAPTERFSSVFATPAIAAENGCSAQTLHSAYIYSADGYASTAPGQFTPIAEAGVYTFDGAGEFSTTNTVSFGGQIIPRSMTGTYNVNSDCTGTVNITGGVTFNFAATRSGGEMRLVVTTPSVSVAGTMVRQ